VSKPVVVAGVDGCRAGWVVVTHFVGKPETARVSLQGSFADVLAMQPRPVMIAIDIPIGLADRVGLGGRACDVAARLPLGDRRSSVFSVPARAAVMQADYRAACDIAFAHSDPPRKVAKQAFNIFPKIREVDALMTPALQKRVVECHPELVFWRLNGRMPLTLAKKLKSRGHPDGLDQRRALLHRWGFPKSAWHDIQLRKVDAGDDDIVDAFANSAAAADIYRKLAHRVPDRPPVDSKGLRMEIWG
jgi:predicted RNase H-like nuclease